jgi:hypothetical protein
MLDGASRSARVIVVLSPAYTGSMFGAAEWEAIWAQDPAARNGASSRYESPTARRIAIYWR